MDCEKPLRPTQPNNQAGSNPQPTNVSISEGDEFTLLFIATFGKRPPEENFSQALYYALVLLPVEGRHATFRRCGILSVHAESPVINGWKNWAFEDLTII